MTETTVDSPTIVFHASSVFGDDDPLTSVLCHRSRPLTEKKERFTTSYKARKWIIHQKKEIASWQHKRVVKGQGYIQVLETIEENEPANHD